MRVPVVVLLSLACSVAALADPIPPRVRLKEARLAEKAEERKAAEGKPAFEFHAPEGFTVADKLQQPDGAPTPAFAASSAAPAATMVAYIEDGKLALGDTDLTDQARKLSDAFIASHPGATIKVMKKDRLKLDHGEAGRILLDTRAKKGPKGRELHYFISSATHHAHLIFVVPAASFAKLEKRFEAAMRATGVAGGAPPAASP